LGWSQPEFDPGERELARSCSQFIGGQSEFRPGPPQLGYGQRKFGRSQRQFIGEDARWRFGPGEFGGVWFFISRGQIPPESYLPSYSVQLLLSRMPDLGRRTKCVAMKRDWS